MNDTVFATNAPKLPAVVPGDAASRHALMEAIAERRRFHRDRVASAIRSGNFWEIVKAELARDYSSLYDNLLAFELEVDHTFARHEH